MRNDSYSWSISEGFTGQPFQGEPTFCHAPSQEEQRNFHFAQGSLFALSSYDGRGF